MRGRPEAVAGRVVRAVRWVVGRAAAAREVHRAAAARGARKVVFCRGETAVVCSCLCPYT